MLFIRFTKVVLLFARPARLLNIQCAGTFKESRGGISEEDEEGSASSGQPAKRKAGPSADQLLAATLSGYRMTTPAAPSTVWELHRVVAPPQALMEPALQPSKRKKRLHIGRSLIVADDLLNQGPSCARQVRLVPDEVDCMIEGMHVTM